MSRLGDAVQLSYDLETRLGRAFGELAERHAADADVFHICSMFAEQCSSQAARLRPHAERLSGTEASTGPTIAGRVDRDEQGTDLLANLTGAFLLAQECWITATVVRQAALAARDEELLPVISSCLDETSTQLRWLETRIKTTAPQALTMS